jgi:6-phosphogluconolactonase (cycloisomerase 2 family)
MKLARLRRHHLMKALSKIAAAGLAASLPAAFVTVGGGLATAAPASDHAVFVETDNPASNQVVSYSRGRDGSLSRHAAYPTGGTGGQLNGSVVDHQASQGALSYDPSRQMLFATNAGSDSVSVFQVAGPNLHLTQVVSSGGSFPVSVAISGDIVYVLNARDGGSVSGFRIAGARLEPIPGSTVDLGYTPVTDATEFTHTPGQVAFSPGGRELLVTTKALGQSVLVYHVKPSGRLDPSPVVNPLGNTPFSLSFATPHRLLLVEAAGYVASFDLNRGGQLSQLSSLATNQAAPCWIAPANGNWYVSNAGSATLTGVGAGRHGVLSDLGRTATNPGTVDAAATPDGGYLYVQTGLNGVLDSFSVAGDGALTAIGTPITVVGGAGGEGIAAS